MEEERFWSKVDASGPCWEWIAALSVGGYGKYSVHSDGKYSYPYAHRHAWETLVGPVPEGADLDHLCRNRKCVNPDHLEPVSRQENVRRGIGPTGLNMSKTHCPQGHEYNELNTFKNPQGHRACKVCRRAYDKRRRPKKEGGNHHVPS